VEKQKNRVTVEIMGEEYTIKGSGLPRSMEQAARHLDGLMRSLAEKDPSLSGYRLAILAAINLAEELLKLKGGYPRYAGEEREGDEEDELV
jgi:cell division protein ZapA